jgi:hypothetical protein
MIWVILHSKLKDVLQLRFKYKVIGQTIIYKIKINNLIMILMTLLDINNHPEDSQAV